MRQFSIKDILAYADDIAICLYSISELHQAINIINKWSNEADVLIKSISESVAYKHTQNCN